MTSQTFLSIYGIAVSCVMISDRASSLLAAIWFVLLVIHIGVIVDEFDKEKVV